MFTKFLTGRINRKQYICYYIATAIAFSLLMAIISTAFGPMNPMAIETESASIAADPLSIPAFIVSILIMIFGFSFDIRRFHDLNKPTSWAVVPLVLGIIEFLPIFQEMNAATYAMTAIQLGIFFYLCFAKGTQGENQYGMQP